MGLDYSKNRAWYVAHTYSGYENKVKIDIEQTIKNRNMEELIFEVRVPTQKVTEMKDGKEKRTEKKLFPGYVLVNMIMTNETWYVIRNTRGVTGFVGPDSKPVPVPQEEIDMLSGHEREVVINFEVGDSVIITEAPWRDTIGKVTNIDSKKKTVTVSVEAFQGRETSLELGFSAVKKL